MQSIVDELKAKNIHFSLMYYGKEDYGTFWDIKSILENREYFQDRFTDCPKTPENMESRFGIWYH